MVGLQTDVLPTWQHLQQDVLTLLPPFAGSVLVLIFGVLAGVVCGRVARKLLTMGKIDERAARVGVAGALGTVGISSTAALLAKLVKWTIIFASTILAMYLVDARLASDLAERFLVYLPNLAGAVLILLGGLVAARFLSRSVLIAAVNREIPSSRLLSDVTRVTIVALTIAIALEQAQIGRTTVLVAFSILFGGVTLAAAIGVGLAVRDVMRQWLLDQLQATPRKREEDALHHW